MDEPPPPPPESSSGAGEPRAMGLTIKIAGKKQQHSGEEDLAGGGGGISNPISPAISISPHLNSPSPPSSAFVSALQSPYISPRALEPPMQETAPAPAASASLTPATTGTLPSPASYSEELPSTSHTPPSERYDGAGVVTAARISFSFPEPRVSPARPSAAPNARLRSCDVYIGFHGGGGCLGRFCRWLKAELELQGIASFVADRAKFADSQSHEITDRIICSAAFGVVVITPSSFLNPFSLEELKFFAHKKNLLPVLFDTELPEIAAGLEDKDCRDAFEGMSRCNEHKLQANDSNWRSCIAQTVGVLQSRLGRKSVANAAAAAAEEADAMPFPRNRHFVGREKELAEIELTFFGCTDVYEVVECAKPAAVSSNGASSGVSDGFADEESDTVKRFISLDVRNCNEPALEAWIEPVRSKHRRSRGGNRRSGIASVVCVSGGAGVGKTELALEFAYRYAQRYKKVLWVGGSARYLRQNILNLSLSLGVDISADAAEKERGRVRSFDEQENDAFQRVKRELFRDVPYLLVVDGLDSEREWWEGKELADLIPRNTGATHVVVTTRLARVMAFEPIPLPPLPATEALLLARGRRKKDYPPEEAEVLRKMDERLGRLSFGLWVVGSLLSELMILPSALLDAVDRISFAEAAFSGGNDDGGFCRKNHFLMKLMLFCFALMDRAKGGGLASRMAIVGSWLAPAPMSAAMLAVAASGLPGSGGGFLWWGDLAYLCSSSCFLPPQARKAEVDAAQLLVKLGLAKKAATPRHPGCWIQLHEITQWFGRMRGGPGSAAAAVHGVMKCGNPAANQDHLWASAFLVFGFKLEPPAVQLRPADMVSFIQKTAMPLAIRSFMAFSRCGSALELLKVCTNILEEAEKSFASRTQEWNGGALCWRRKKEKAAEGGGRRVDEYVWQEVTLLKATLLETRAKLLLRGGLFDSGEELCRTCISIRTVMLGHGHPQTAAAQETLARLVRFRSKS